MEEVWQELSADLSSFIQNEDSEIPIGASPFDPISDVQEEEQKYILISFRLYFILLCHFGIEERTGFEYLKQNHWIISKERAHENRPFPSYD